MRRTNQCRIIVTFGTVDAVCFRFDGGMPCRYGTGEDSCRHYRDGNCRNREARNDAATKLGKTLRRKYGVWVEVGVEHVDPPPSQESVSGLYADCTPTVSAEGMFCPDCDGVGRIPERREDVYCDPEHECAFCQGTGIVLRDHK